MKTILWMPAEYDGLDPGIRFAVRVLHAEGIETCQSCEGGPGHSYADPTVDLPLGGVDNANGLRAVAVLSTYGIAMRELAQVWSLDRRGLPHETLWRVVLARPIPERASDEPSFIWGYSVRSGETG